MTLKKRDRLRSGTLARRRKFLCLVKLKIAVDIHLREKTIQRKNDQKMNFAYLFILFFTSMVNVLNNINRKGLRLMYDGCLRPKWCQGARLSPVTWFNFFEIQSEKTRGKVINTRAQMGNYMQIVKRTGNGIYKIQNLMYNLYKF